MAIALRLEGRLWFHEARPWGLWTSDAFSNETSQVLADPYIFTHVLHGVLLYGALAWLLPRTSVGLKLAIAVAFEAAWEILENSPWVIDRYRDTAAQGYSGDSVVNSLGDLAACIAGFYLARWLGLRWSIVFFIAVELILLCWIRDNLTLNVLMLLYPSDALKTWQNAQ